MPNAARVLSALRSLRCLEPEELDAVRSLLDGDSSPLVALGIDPEATIPEPTVGDVDIAERGEANVEDEPHPSQGGEPASDLR